MMRGTRFRFPVLAIAASVLIASCTEAPVTAPFGSPEDTEDSRRPVGPEIPGQLERVIFTISLSRDGSVEVAPEDGVPPAFLVVSADRGGDEVLLSVSVRNGAELPLSRPLAVHGDILRPAALSWSDPDTGVGNRGTWDYNQSLPYPHYLRSGAESEPRTLSIQVPWSERTPPGEQIRVTLSVAGELTEAVQHVPDRPITEEESTAGYHADMVIVEFHAFELSTEEQRDFLGRHQLIGMDYFRSLGAYVVHLPSGRDVDPKQWAENLQGDPQVRIAIPSILFFPHGAGLPSGSSPLPPTSHQRDTYFDRMWLNEADLGNRPGEGVIIGVLERGIRTDNVDIASRIVGSWFYGDRDPDVQYPEPGNHASEVASVMVGSPTQEGFGGAVPYLSLFDIDVRIFEDPDDDFSSSGTIEASSSWAVTDGLEFVANNIEEHRISVLNMSFGTRVGSLGRLDPFSSLRSPARLLSDIREAGIITVAAAGNCMDSPVMWPARDPNVIAVGGTNDPINRRWTTSSVNPNCDPGEFYGSALGPELEFWAPGEFIRTTGLRASGTSVAAPTVSALAGLLKWRYPGMNSESIRTLLNTFVMPFPEDFGDGAEYGQGITVGTRYPVRGATLRVLGDVNAISLPGTVSGLSVEITNSVGIRIADGSSVAIRGTVRSVATQEPVTSFQVATTQGFVGIAPFTIEDPGEFEIELTSRFNDPLIVPLGSSPSEDGAVVFADMTLEAIVREEIGVPSGPIHSSDMLRLIELNGTCMQIESIEGLQAAVNLEIMNLGCSGDDERDGLANRITDLSPISGFTNLVRVVLSNNDITDLRPLSASTGMRHLWTWGNDQIEDLSPLAGMTSLVVLGIGSPLVRDISVLSNFQNLDALVLRGLDGVDLSPVGDLSILRILEVLGTRNWRNYESLGQLQSLRFLNLTGEGVTDPVLTFVSGLGDLELLWLQNTAVVDVTPVQQLYSLGSLWFVGNPVQDLTPIRDLESLQNLRVRRTEVSNLFPLEGLPSLRSIDLQMNRISEIGSLLANSQINPGAFINLSYNPLSERAYCEDIPVLRSRDITVWVEGVTYVCPDAGKPNLQITNIRIDPTSPTTNDYIESYVRITNFGSVPSGTWELGIQVNDRISRAADDYPSIPAGETVEIPFGLGHLDAGLHAVIFRVDPREILDQEPFGTRMESLLFTVAAAPASTAAGAAQAPSVGMPMIQGAPPRIDPVAFDEWVRSLPVDDGITHFGSHRWPQ